MKNSLLTAEQSNALEQLQKQAMKIVFGWTVAYHTVLEEKDLEPLSDHRLRLVDQFAVKTAKHPRFGPEWFEEKKITRDGLRPHEKLNHVRPNTERFKTNPVCFMRKRLEIKKVTTSE